jgi:hypothetical protein
MSAYFFRTKQLCKIVKVGKLKCAECSGLVILFLSVSALWLQTAQTFRWKLNYQGSNGSIFSF